MFAQKVILSHHYYVTNSFNHRRRVAVFLTVADAATVGDCQKTATVAGFGDSRRFWRLQSAVWTGLNELGCWGGYGPKSGKTIFFAQSLNFSGSRQQPKWNIYIFFKFWTKIL